MRLYNLGLLIARNFVDKKRIEFNFPAREVWFHSASIGELNAIMPVIKKVKSKWITTTSRNGVLALPRYNLEGSLLPLDTKDLMQKALEQVNPKIFVFSENEYWPNLFLQLKAKNIPYGILNLKIHPKFFIQQWWLKQKQDFFKKAEFILCQNQYTQETLKRLGVEQSHILVAPNLKLANEPNLKKDAENFAERLKKKYPRLITCASLRKEEIQTLFPVLSHLLKKFTDLSIVLIPRYLEHSDNIVKQAVKYFGQCSIYPRESRITLIKEFGLVPSLVKHSIFYFVGGTFSKNVGGHNPIEGASFGVVGVTGPDTYKIDDLKELFVKISSLDQLEESLTEILRNPMKLKNIKNHLRAKVEEAKLAVKKILEILREYDVSV